MKGGFQSVKNLPPPGLMVLVKGTTHAGVALGCCDQNGRWDVQPYKEAWYWTETGITHWAYITQRMGKYSVAKK